MRYTIEFENDQPFSRFAANGFAPPLAGVLPDFKRESFKPETGKDGRWVAFALDLVDALEESAEEL